jgi:hypothetical protein
LIFPLIPSPSPRGRMEFYSTIHPFPLGEGRVRE